MPLRTKVIINEVTNLSDARYCAGMAVDYIGFRIDEDHPKYIDAKEFEEITDWVAGVDFLGETCQAIEMDSLSHRVSTLMIDDLVELNSYGGPPVFWSTNVSDIDHKLTELIKLHKAKILGLILTNEQDAINDQDKLKISSLADELEVFIGYGVDEENVLRILQELPVTGIALRGSDELRPGYKDYDQLADILEKLELDD